jgi:phosphoenolpyruvate phosphomutase
MGVVLKSDERSRPVAGNAARLGAMLASPDLRFLMEAHNGLSAKIVEEAGFEGIWASGLSISAALGVRDNNEASWTQVLEVIEFMADATTIPILLDGDTGYGNFNNFRRLVRKLCQRGVAGVCIEDKQFPKTNSFLGENQPLADIDEFCGKIKAGKDSQTDSDFNVVARIEALIAGWGMDEALRRAEAYHAAGADALLIHSKKSNPAEILSFCREWDNRCPVVIVPTKYYATPTDRFREARVSLVIWANHNMRAAVSAMRETSRRIMEEESLTGVEDEVARLGDIFALAGNEELEAAENRYLGTAGESTQAVILAATRGGALGDLTAETPKCMLDVRGESLLRRQVRSLNALGVRDIAVVAGYRRDRIDLEDIEILPNEAYETTGEAASLACARDKLDGPVVISYGDILFRPFVLDMLMKSEADIAVVADAAWRDRVTGTERDSVDLVRCTVPYTTDFLDDAPAGMTAIGSDLDNADGEWIGLMKLTARGARLVGAALDVMASEGKLDEANLPDLLTRVIEMGEEPAVLYITGNWLDVNDAFDLAQARNVT